MKYKDKVIVSNCTSTWCHKSSSCENFTFTDWIKSIWAQAGRGSIREKQERDALQSRKEAILAQALLSETCDRKTYLAIVFIGQLLFFFYQKERCYGSEILNVCMSNQKSHYTIIQGEMGLFLTFSVFELQRGYLYQNGVEFRQKVIGAG